MSLYKFDNENAFIDTYPSNLNGYIPPNFTDIPVISVAQNEVAIFDGSAWSAVQDNRGLLLYSEADGTERTNTSIYIPDTGFQTIEPNVPYPTWDGTQWITNNSVRRQTEINAIVCDLPNGLLIPIIKREDFKNSLDEMDTLGTDTAIIDEVSYRRVEIEYILAYFEYETQRIYNN